MTALVVVCALLVQAQDDRVRELVGKLESGGIEERAEAERELVRAGEVALAALRAAARSGAAELKARATRVIDEIESDAAVRTRYGESKRVTVRAKAASLDDVIADVARQSGVTLERTQLGRTGTVTVDFADVSLLEALDRICRAYGPLDYDCLGPARFRMRNGKRIDWPTAYVGSFCVRPARIMDFPTGGGRGVIVEFEGEHDRCWLARHLFAVDLVEAVDDQGVVLGRLPVRGGEAIKRGSCALEGISATAARVTLRGEATFAVVVGREDAVFDKLEVGQKREAGGWTIELTEADGRCVHFKVRGMGRRDERGSFVLIDNEGREHSNAMPLVDAQAGGTRLSIPLNLQGGRTLRSFRVEVGHKVRLKRMPFELKDVKLP